MAHKVHPKAYRLRELADWNSRWLEKKKLPQYLEEDFKIREFLKKKIGRFGLEKVEIERFPGRTIIIISSARPGLIIGRGGEGIENLKRELAKKISRKEPKKTEIKLEVKEVKNHWSSAPLVAQWIVQQIEKRVGHRRVLKQALDKVMANRQIQGARVEVAGRLGGTDIARREWLKKGRLPRQNLRADIDYANAEAMIPQGTIGVKVWIYKGERFD